MLKTKSPRSVGEGTLLAVSDTISVRLLGLEIGNGGSETYHVGLKVDPQGHFRSALMRHAGGKCWDIIEGHAIIGANVTLGSTDDVFAFALGEGATTVHALQATVEQNVPHWPASVTQRLAARRLSGAGTIAFDADWFSAQLMTSAIDRPMLFPNATSKLGLADLERAGVVLRTSVSENRGVKDRSFAETLLRAFGGETTTVDDLDWDGEGRLIGEYTNGELGQIGADMPDGCRAAVGKGSLHVVFKPSAPLGLGLGPLVYADAEDKPVTAKSVGWGAEVGEVDAGGAAERAGVMPGMALSRLTDPERLLPAQGPTRMRFEAVLDEIDTRRAAGDDLAVTFDTAASVSHLYAVEMPAAAALATFAAAVGAAPPTDQIDVGVGKALRDCAPLWREETPRLFLGEPGSLTCAHTDICPQLEVAHGLIGLKVLGVASSDATPRLKTEHAEDEATEATRVPTDRPLSRRQARLLGDADVSLAVLLEGDLAVFDSGALHFASNGNGGFSGALYHGMITAPVVPRLRIAAANDRGRSSAGTDGYHEHLYAADLLRIVEPLLGV